MKATVTEQMIAGLESVFGRKLTDEEHDQVVVWQKCRDAAHFVECFPSEWKMFKDMLSEHIEDARQRWIDLLHTPPNKLSAGIELLHAHTNGIFETFTNFIDTVEAAPEMAKQVPDAVKEGVQQMRSQPQEV